MLRTVADAALMPLNLPTQIASNLLTRDLWRNEVHIAKDLARLSRVSRAWLQLCQEYLWPKFSARLTGGKAPAAPKPPKAAKSAAKSLPETVGAELCSQLDLPASATWLDVRAVLEARGNGLRRDVLVALQAVVPVAKKGASNKDRVANLLAALPGGSGAAAADAAAGGASAAAAGTSTTGGGAPAAAAAQPARVDTRCACDHKARGAVEKLKHKRVTKTDSLRVYKLREEDLYDLEYEVKHRHKHHQKIITHARLALRC